MRPLVGLLVIIVQKTKWQQKNLYLRRDRETCFGREDFSLLQVETRQRLTDVGYLPDFRIAILSSGDDVFVVEPNQFRDLRLGMSV